MKRVRLDFRGLHLVETAIFLTLLGALYLVAVPVISEQRNLGILREETRRLRLLAEDLVLAAMQQNTEMHLTILESSYQVSNDEDTTSIPTVVDPSVRLELRASSPTRVAFYPTGSVSPARIVLRQDDRSCTISISLRGRVQGKC